MDSQYKKAKQKIEDILSIGVLLGEINHELASEINTTVQRLSDKEIIELTELTRQQPQNQFAARCIQFLSERNYRLKEIILYTATPEQLRRLGFEDWRNNEE